MSVFFNYSLVLFLFDPPPANRHLLLLLKAYCLVLNALFFDVSAMDIAKHPN